MKCLPAKVFNDLSRCSSADRTVDLNKHPSLRSDETPIKVIYKQSISLNHSGFLCVSDTQYQNFLKGKRKGGENPAFSSEYMSEELARYSKNMVGSVLKNPS